MNEPYSVIQQSDALRELDGVDLVLMCVTPGHNGYVFSATGGDRIFTLIAGMVRYACIAPHMHNVRLRPADPERLHQLANVLPEDEKEMVEAQHVLDISSNEGNFLIWALMVGPDLEAPDFNDIHERWARPLWFGGPGIDSV